MAYNVSRYVKFFKELIFFFKLENGLFILARKLKKKFYFI